MNKKKSKALAFLLATEILTSDMYDSASSKLYDIENGKQILVPVNTVAIIDKVPYDSLDKAVEASTEGSTIKLIEGLEIDSIINLDLKDKKI